MVLNPRYRFELYKKLSDETHSTTPIVVTGFDDLSYRGGIETTKDVLDVKFPSLRINGSAFQNFLGKTTRTDNVFGVDDEVKIYAYYNTLPDTKDDALLLAGRISSMNYNNRIFTLKVVNRTEELLNTMVPYSTRAYTGSANTSPTAIKQMVSRLNQFNNRKEVFAYLSTELNPITGSYGLVVATQSDFTDEYTNGLGSWASNGTAFPTVDYNETWKPVYYNIEKLSSAEYTGDTRTGEYIFYLKYSRVLPEYQDTYGTTVNELVWRPKSLISQGVLTEGKDFINPVIDLSSKDILNMLIVNAGTDRRGAGITGVAYDSTSMGKYGTKTGYYTKSRKVFSNIWSQEVNWLLAAGSTFDSDGMPSDAVATDAYPTLMSFSNRDFNGNFTGESLTAESKKEWNQYLRDEARWQATKEAETVLERLGNPRYTLKADMLLGSNTLVAGNIYQFIVPSYGWEGNAANPSYTLRVKTVSHSLNMNGWTTQFDAEEDEKVISDLLGNSRSNIE